MENSSSDRSVESSEQHPMVRARGSLSGEIAQNVQHGRSRRPSGVFSRFSTDRVHRYAEMAVGYLLRQGNQSGSSEKRKSEYLASDAVVCRFFSRTYEPDFRLFRFH